MEVSESVSILVVARVLEQHCHLVPQIRDSRKQPVLVVLLLGKGCVGVCPCRHVEVLLVLLEHHLLVHVCFVLFELLMRLLNDLLVVVQLVSVGSV